MRNRNGVEIYITCKKCNERFSRLEYMKNKSCENPDCTCPEVVRVREQAKKVIENAQESSKQEYQVNTKRGTIPTGYVAEVPQYMQDVPDVLVTNVIVPKGRKNRS